MLRVVVFAGKSPSSRRAWIEINLQLSVSQYITVALLAEGVDRNVDEVLPGDTFQVVALLAEGVDRNG